MADENIKQVMQDAILDADSLEQFINGSDSETVLTRLSAEYPTLQKALKELFGSGGIAERFKTLADLQSSSLGDGEYALVADDTDDINGVYIKEGGAWRKSEFGNSWSSEITELKHRLYKIFPKDLGKSVDIPYNGKYLSRSSGNSSSSVDFGVSDFIKVYAYDTVYIKVFGGSIAGTALALYDDDYNFVKAYFTDEAYRASLIEDSITIPTDGYIRVQNRFAVASGGSEDGVNSLSNPIVTLTTDAYSESINSIIYNYLGEQYPIPVSQESLPQSGEYLLRSSGRLDRHADFGVSDFIKVYDGDTVDLKVFSGSNTGTALALYDDDYNFVKAYFTDEAYRATLIEASVTIPSDGYIRVQNRFSSLANPTVSIRKTSFKGRIKSIISEYLSDNYEPPTLPTGLTSNGDTCVIRQGSSILCLGASYATDNRSWFPLLCSALGVTGVNKAIGGTGISHVATALFNNTLLTQSILDSCEAIILSHLWDFDIMARKDVRITGVEYTDEVVSGWSVADYESKASTLLATATVKLNMTDSLASFFFDYVIKKMKLVFYDERLNESSPFYNKTEGKPFKVVLTTNWHDGRPKYNSSVRDFCKKWGLPLIRLDDNIGFGLSSEHPSGSQESLLYADDSYEINGVRVGHHFTGGEGNEIPLRIAGIAKKTFVVL